MRYYDARHKIETGDVLICAGHWLMSRAIRFFTKEKYSHVGIAIWLDFGGQKRLCMFESMEGSGVQIVPLFRNLSVNYWPYNSKIWWCPLKGLDGKKVADYYMQKWGDGYAYPYQFFVDAIPPLQYIRHRLGKGIKVGKNHYHCSELCTLSLIHAGYDNSKGKDPAITTPGDVSRFSCTGDPIELEQDEHIFTINTESGW